MVKMKFKDFEFPDNPLFIETAMAQSVRENLMLSGDFIVSCNAEKATVIKADGCFWGEKAADASLKLKVLMKNREAGWLFLPDGSCFNAFMASLEIKEDAKKNCVSYNISFIEKCTAKRSKYNFYFTYAQDDENMFDIAHRCDKSIEDLMKLNDFSNPFSVKNGDKVVLQ